MLAEAKPQAATLSLVPTQWGQTNLDPPSLPLPQGQQPKIHGLDNREREQDFSGHLVPKESITP